MAKDGQRQIADALDKIIASERGHLLGRNLEDSQGIPRVMSGGTLSARRESRFEPTV